MDCFEVGIALFQLRSIHTRTSYVQELNIKSDVLDQVIALYLGSFFDSCVYGIQSVYNLVLSL